MKKFFAVLAVAAAVGAVFAYGFLSHKLHWFPYRPLRNLSIALRPVPQPHRWVAAKDAAHLSQREQIDTLTQLPYLQGYNPATGRQGVTRYDEARVFPGWNLAVSAHAAAAQLMDMRGAARHRWAFDAHRAWPDLKPPTEAAGYDKYWRRAELLPEGDLLVVWEYIGLARIDRNSRLKWASLCGAHHDLQVAPDGAIWVLTREKKMRPEINREDPVLEDFLSVLSPDGRILRRISLLDAFSRSDYAAALAPMRRDGDLFHANSIQILDGSLADRSPAFRAGNVLVSIHALGILAILDPSAEGTEKIVWALSGPWRGQHASRLTAAGRLLLFDNFGRMRVGASRVLEVDPFTQQIAWRYREAKGQTIFSESNGGVQRLGNGNTLIVESNAGRAFEVTESGDLVWEYLNTFRPAEHKDSSPR